MRVTFRDCQRLLFTLLIVKVCHRFVGWARNSPFFYLNSLVPFSNSHLHNPLADPCVLVATLKFFFTLLTFPYPPSCLLPSSFFYTNDLKILIDILIRESQNVEDDTLKMNYLRLLHVVLVKTQYHKIDNSSYKKQEIHKCFSHFANSNDGSVVGRVAKRALNSLK